MQFATFLVPISDDGRAQDELNLFLRQRRVIGIDRQLIGVAGGGHAWAFCVEYLDGEGPTGRAGGRIRKQSIDYKEVLNEDDFQVYVRLRELRKRLAEADGVPVYALFTNAQLAAMAKDRCASKAALAAIDGVGEAKIARFAEVLLAAIAEDACPAAP